MVAATNNSNGVAAVNWNGRVLPVRVAGKCGADPRDIVDGMRWAAGLRPARSTTQRQLHRVRADQPEPGARDQHQLRRHRRLRAVPGDDQRAAARRGVVVVAAAGNERGAVTRPANCPGAIGVGAVNRDGFKTNYSNFGPELTVTTVGGDPKSDGVWGRLLGDDGVLGVDIIGATSPQAARLSRTCSAPASRRRSSAAP